MKSTYTILWFDDTDEVFEAIQLDIEALKSAIHGMGFDPKIIFTSDPENFMNLKPWRDYDLIVVDYSLDTYDKHGDEFIELIRNSSVYTEIIFYSNKPAEALWEAIFSKRLEGVFVTNRQNIAIKIQQVAISYIRKVFDLESMRGLVMAQVGDIDTLFHNLIRSSFLELEPPQQEEIFTDFTNKLSQFSDNTAANIQQFEESRTIDKLLELCESSWQKWYFFSKCSSRHHLLSHKEFVNYDNEVLKPRNALAHGMPSIDGDGNHIFNHRGYEFVYNDQISIDLLQTIKSYKSRCIDQQEILQTTDR